MSADSHDTDTSGAAGASPPDPAPAAPAPAAPAPAPAPSGPEATASPVVEVTNPGGLPPSPPGDKEPDKKPAPPATQSSPALATITETAGEIPQKVRLLFDRLLKTVGDRIISPARASALALAAMALWKRFNELLLAAYMRAVPSEQNRIFILTVVIGGICGLAAVLFHLGIRLAETLFIDRALSATGYWWVPMTILTPVLGALVCGAMLQYFFPAARGSGIPQVKVVYAINSGRLRLRDSLAKFVIGVLQIGTGASLGREGPTVHICAGIATGLGKLFALSPPSVRRLIPVGAAAGIAAAFNAPLAAVTFTTEEIVGDLDHTVLSGVVVAAALAAVIERTVLGEQPVFELAKSYELTHMTSLIIYAALGVVAAGVSHVFTRGLLELRLFFRRQKTIPGWAQPGIGGLVTGVAACAIFATLHAQGVTGGGYVTLNSALNGNVVAHVMLALFAAKLVATLFSYSSGGAGGIFAPALFVGGMLGGAFSFFDSWALGHTDTEPGAFALVGMGAVFAGVIRAPITSFLIIFEMTNGYGLILPLMIANSTSYALARKWHRKPIYEALIEQDGIRLPHKSSAAAALSALRVEQAMTVTDIITLPAWLSVREALDSVGGRGFSAYPVLDETKSFVGLVSEAKLRRLLAEGRSADNLRDQLRARETLRADQPLLDAIARMNKLGVRQMAVVDPLDARRLVGMFAMSDVIRAHARAHAAANAATADTNPEAAAAGGTSPALTPAHGMPSFTVPPPSAGE